MKKFLLLFVFLLAFLPTPAHAEGIQFCYIKHHRLNPTYALASAFEVEHVFPAPTGPGEGQSGWVLLDQSKMAFVSSLNTADYMRWAVRDNSSGSLYSRTASGTRWFVILMPGNIVEITEVVGHRGKVAGLINAPLSAIEINRDTTPYFVSWTPVIWKDGRITNPPRGYGVVPIFNPGDYPSHAIEEIWVEMSDLICPIDLSQSYKTSIASWVWLGLRVHWDPSLSSPVSTKIYPGNPFWIWKVEDGWALTDWGWILLRSTAGWDYTTGK